MKISAKHIHKPQVRMICDYCGKNMIKGEPLKYRGFLICNECVSQETAEFKARFINRGFAMPTLSWNPRNNKEEE